MCFSSRFSVTLASLVLAAVAEDAAAQRIWAIALAAEVDDESNDSVLTTFNLGLSDQTWLTFSAGRDSAPREGADVRARTLGAALDHRFGFVGVGLAAERWGDPDSIESADLEGSIYVQNDRFRLALERESRDIEIRFTVTGPLDRAFERTAGLDADGTGLSVRIRLVERWDLYASAMEYDYSRDVTLLPRADSLNLLSTSALTLANSFVDEKRSMGVEWTGPNKVVGLHANRDRSAVDSTELTSVSVAVLVPVGRRVDLEVNLGRSDSDLLGAGLYGGLLFLIYGGG